MSFQYLPPNPDLWHGRSSSSKEYLHENVHCLALEGETSRLGSDPTGPGSDSAASKAKSAFILGYASDLGVARNSGRVGAAQGPEAFRSALAKLPWHLGSQQLIDLGDLTHQGDDLSGLQAGFSKIVMENIKAGNFSLAVGGGHDIAYAHYTGLSSAISPDQKLGIINFDAHLDLRLPGDAAHSGSPFYQISQDCKAKQRAFDYACIGVREDANIPELLNRARELDVLMVYRDALEDSLPRFEEFLANQDYLYLTIDLDGFASAFAPGVSAASPLGFSPIEVYPFLDRVLASGKLLGADLAELNPTYDRDNQTAALAAGLAHRILHKRKEVR
ncbi:formiminoglutamase [Robiginitalea myxolifaciens]|uniref:Formimidoylglutamase n=1 Tax=Robiginitalea myxolifaciens TaxID=400055 RepID=A0A1I6FV03_9FLAO|nr:formimidoylglutamase [Robiginitalea myxolifaciens]SFR33753.1 formiminoglutamase [Robiginitalea myxolifaciens]